MKILVVEDERDLAESIVTYLTKEGYLCDIAGDFNTADDQLAAYDYDGIIVDITLPDGNGLNLIRHLKENQNPAGIIIISAKNALDDKVTGLDIGADDYLTKPFHLSELNARLKSLLRRQKFNGQMEMALNEILIIPEMQQVMVNNQVADLTQKEYDLLLYFVTNKNRVLTKYAISEHLWGDQMDTSDNFDFIYTHIKNLRKKLVELGCADYIKTVYGMGYKFSIT